MKRKIVTHTIRSPKIPEPLRLAVAADLHNGTWEDVLAELAGCDAILVPGDLVNRHRASYHHAARFLREAPDIAPVFYSVGNHELKCAFKAEWDRLVEEGFRLLMCHHPEMYRDDVAGRDIDFTVCGHAHGGQVQIFGRGLYAPGQGLFPKLTHGVHDGGKMIISRGMTNGAMAPRINNPLELIILTLEPASGNAV